MHRRAAYMDRMALCWALLEGHTLGMPTRSASIYDMAAHIP